MLQGIARLAIAAPRRIIAVAVLVMVGAAIFGIPVTKSLSAGGFQDPASRVVAGGARCSREKFGQGDMQMLITVTSDAGATERRRPGRRHRHRRGDFRPRPMSAECQLGVDRAAVGGAGADQQGRQDRADRRGHHRRRERRPETRQDSWPTNWSTTATASPCAPAATR